MSQDHSSVPNRPGFLARRRTALLAGAVGLGVLGLVGADGARFSLPSMALAQPVQTTGQTAGQATGFADVVEKVRPAVVSVKVKSKGPKEANDDAGPRMGPGMGPGGDRDRMMEEFFKQFGFGPRGEGPMMPHPRRRFGMSQGSGFFISGDGYIVTNNHVVDDASEVEVVTDNGKTYEATIVGVDQKTDLALLKIKDGGTFPYVELSSQTPRVGDWVLAVGNPFGLGGTVTAGIVSARGRDIRSGPYDDFIQIDAPVNRGNSGGPTFDIHGNVIGVNTAIFSPSGGSVGIGFAIPADTVKRVVSELKEKGEVTRGWIGVQIQPITPEIAESLGLEKPEGAIVVEATKDGPALAAGIQSGDAITAVNGQPVANPKELARSIAALQPGKDAELTVWRDGKARTVKLALGKLPNDTRQASVAPAQPSKPASLEALGVELAPAGSVAGVGDSGVVVVDVDPSGVAGELLRAGDVILDVAGKPVKTPSDVETTIAAVKQEGKKTVLMRVKNGDAVRFVALPLAKT